MHDLLKLCKKLRKNQIQTPFEFLDSSRGFPTRNNQSRISGDVDEWVVVGHVDPSAINELSIRPVEPMPIETLPAEAIPVEEGCMPIIRLTNPILSDSGQRCFVNSIFSNVFYILTNQLRLLFGVDDYYKKDSLADIYIAALKNVSSFPTGNLLVNLEDLCFEAWKSLNLPIGSQQDAAEFLNCLLDHLLDVDIKMRDDLLYYASTQLPMTGLSGLFCLPLSLK